MMRPIFSLIGLIGLWGGLAAAQPQDDDAPRPTVYRGAAVLDIASGEWRRGHRLVVEGERIVAIQSAAAPFPEAAEIVDVTGLFATPGLIDMHKHYALGQPLDVSMMLARRDIYSGITAARDMVGDTRMLAFLARQTALGEWPGPDIFYSALIAGPTFLDDGRMQGMREGLTPEEAAWIAALTPETDLPLAVARARGSGARGIKVYANLTPDLVAAVVSEAHRQGLRAWVHGAVFPTTSAQAAEAGADTLSHVCMLAYQVQDPPPASYDYADRPELDEAGHLAGRYDREMQALYATLRENGTIIDTTLWVYPVIERMRAEMTDNKPPIYCSTDLAAHITREAHEAGVALATGTDAWADDESLWPSLFEELELLRDRAGLSPIETLRAATVNAARGLGKADEMGRLEPGMLANIAFFSADPLAPDADFRTVGLTVKRGRPYWRRDFVHRVPEGE